MTSGAQPPNPSPTDDEVPPGMPTWVKYLLVSLLAVVVLVVLAMLIVGGDHGPSRHGSGSHSAPANLIDSQARL